jgi:ABC-2 type transport system permease protein
VPVSRTRLLAVKYAGALAYCLAAAFVVAIVGTLMGALLFPIGPVTLLSGTQVSYGAGLVRLLLVALYIAAMMAGLAAIGLFVSTLTESAIAAMATTAVLSVLSQVLDQVRSSTGWRRGCSATTGSDYGDLLRDPIATGGLTRASPPPPRTCWSSARWRGRG